MLAGVPWPAAVSTLNALGEMVAVGEVLTPGQAPVVVGEVELAVGRVVELCDTHTPLVLERPFGRGGSEGDQQGCAAWIRRARPGQPERDDQVWKRAAVGT